MSQETETTPVTLPIEDVVRKFKDVDECRVFVEKFNGQVVVQNKAFKQAMEELQVKKRVETYIMLGQAYGMASTLLAPENSEHYVALLSERNIAVARDEQNKFLPFCKLLFGRYDKDKNFVVDPSANGYAPVLRYFEDNGISSAEVPQHIETYKSDHGTKLVGIRKHDQHAHGAGPDLDAEQAVLDLVLAEPALAQLTVEPDSLLGTPVKGKLTAMWGEWNEGQFIPRGFVNATAEQLHKLARKQAVAREPELRRRELDRKNAEIAALKAQLKTGTSR